MHMAKAKCMQQVPDDSSLGNPGLMGRERGPGSLGFAHGELGSLLHHPHAWLPKVSMDVKGVPGSPSDKVE